MIRFEKASVEDIKILTEIKKLAYNDETRRFGPGRDGGPPGYDSVEETKRLIKTFKNFKILFDEKVIGCFWIHKQGEEYYELEDFCIHPKYHNKGLGTKSLKLMDEYFQYIKKWTLSTPYYSVRNQYLYEKLGFKKIGKSEDGFLFFYEKILKNNE